MYIVISHGNVAAGTTRQWASIGLVGEEDQS